MPDSDLSTLLEHLRLRGIAVGAAELQRLQAVFAQSPALERHALLNILQTLLAKDDYQRRIVQRVFEQLVPQDSNPVEAEHYAAESLANSTISNTTSETATQRRQRDTKSNAALTTEKKPFNVLIVGVIALLLIAATFIVVGYEQKEKAEHHKSHIAKQAAKPKQVDAKLKVDERQTSGLNLIHYLPHWQVIPEEIRIANPKERLRAALVLLIGSGLGLLWLWHQSRRKTRKRRPRPVIIDGTGRSPLPAPQNQSDYYLLSAPERRAMTWGAQHYVSDQPLTRLDIQRSVQASARQGLPSIHFQQASRSREVWLWQDQSSSNPDVRRLAQETYQQLHQANIPVQQGYFHGLPQTVMSQHGEVLWTDQHEYPENQPLVLVLADADNLLNRSMTQPQTSQTTLRRLSHWEHLCLIDCSPEPGSLCRFLKSYGLACRLPREMADWIVRQHEATRQLPDYCPLDEVHYWAMACALPERPLMEAEIRSLHDVLGLSCAWQYQQLRHYGKATGTGFDFRVKRISLLQTFSQLLQSDDGKGDGATQHIVRFWLDRYQEVDKLRSQRQSDTDQWQETQRQREHQRDTALLQLWQTNPAHIAQAADTLADLHQHPTLRHGIETRLAAYSCHDWVNSLHMPDTLILPFRWQQLNGVTQQQLKRAGLGGAEDVALRADNTTRALLAVLAGVMLLALVLGVKGLIPEPPAIETLPYSPKPAQVLNSITETQHVWLGTAKFGTLPKQQLGINEVLPVSWQRNVQPARLTPPAAPFKKAALPDEYTELWFAGEKRTVARPAVADWPLVSVAVIAEAPDQATTRQLAALLLDTGSVDQVLIGHYWQRHIRAIRQQWAAIPHSKMQWLYINAAPAAPGFPYQQGHYAHFAMNSAALLTKLKQNRQYTASALGASTSANDARLYGRAPELGKPIELAQGMTLMPIPRGTFMMGSNEGTDDEKPVHEVSIDYDFYMSRTEVTFAQYDAYIAAQGVRSPSDSGWGRDDRPVINVSWNDAQGYVQWLSQSNTAGLACRLPSEAEWEYAARAGTTTVYSWGNDIGTNKANCDGCGSQWNNQQTAPVRQFPANKFGLHDMHGNVWEWVQDCWHDNYQNAPGDGSAWESQCSNDASRVLRGGSWIDPPSLLRSANRSWNGADVRNDYDGFRVVCSPPSDR